MNIKNSTCTILLILLSLFVRAQQPGIHFDPDFDKNFQVYGGINNACDDARDYYKKANDRTAQYEQDVEEYKNGLFCVDCKRSARQIQDQTHETLTEHLKHTPHHETMPATTQMYADLYKSYRGDFDPLKKEYDQKISECTNGNVKLKNECAEITTQFDNKLSLATANLAKLNKPLSAGDKTRYTNSLNELRSQYTQEINKGNAADPSKLSQIVSSVDDLNIQVTASINNTELQNSYSTSQQTSSTKVTTSKSKNAAITNANQQTQQASQNLHDAVSNLGNTLIALQEQKARDRDEQYERDKQETARVEAEKEAADKIAVEKRRADQENEKERDREDEAEALRQRENARALALANENRANAAIRATVGKIAANFTIKKADGTGVSLSAFLGKKVLLIFWSSANDKSINEFIEINKNLALLRATGYNIIGIGMEFSRYQWTNAVAENNLPGTQLCEFGGNETDTSTSYNINIIPAIFLINAAGQITAQANTFLNLRTSIK